MIRVLYNGMEVFPSLDNIEIIKTNSAISDEGSHSYNISFDLRVRENLLAYSHRNRLQTRQTKPKAKIQIWNGPHLLMSGTAVILKIEGYTLELQATEGDLSIIEDAGDRTVHDLYEMGEIPYNDGRGRTYDYEEINWIGYPGYPVCFPIVAKTDEEESFYAATEAELDKIFYKNFINVYGLKDRSPQYFMAQPYFLDVVRRVFMVFGYDINFDEYLNYENNKIFKELYILTQTAPYASEGYPGRGNGPGRPYYNHILPKWSLSKFLDEVKRFLNCEFYYDEQKKEVRVVSRKQICKDKNPFEIEEVVDVNENVIVDISYEDKEFVYNNMSYNLPENEFNRKQDISDEVLSECITKPYDSADPKTPDAYVVYEANDGVGTKYGCFIDRGLRRICTMQKTGEGRNQLDIVPAAVFPRYVNFYSLNKDNIVAKVAYYCAKSTFVRKYEGSTGTLGFESAINEGTKDKEAPSVIEVAFLGENREIAFVPVDLAFPYEYWGTHSLTYPKYEDDMWALFRGVEASKMYNLSPKYLAGTMYADTYGADFSVEYTIRFIAPILPDTNSLYLIKGQRYCCKQLKQTIENGKLSQVVEGIFYKLL